MAGLAWRCESAKEFGETVRKKESELENDRK